MIIKSIHIKENLDERLIKFSANNNLIFSDSNSRGKTTLLRILLYSLGFSIPNTKKIKFNTCNITTTLILDNNEEVVLTRTNTIISVKDLNSEEEYIVPSQLFDLHQRLFGTDNNDLLNNILGSFYFDQEKGWTLLNRGVVIGSIHFNIEELVRGIANIDCKKMLNQIKQKQQDLNRFKQMYSVSEYQNSINKEKYDSNPFSSILESQITQLKIEYNTLEKEFKRVNKVIKQNCQIKEYISQMKIVVKTPDGTEMTVTEENVVGLNDSIEYLDAKKKMIAAEMNAVKKNIDSKYKTQRVEEHQLSFFENEETIVDIFDERILNIPINQEAVKKKIDSLQKEIKELKKYIKDKTKYNNEVVNSIYTNAKRYLIELGTDNLRCDIFTSELKELTGAILHKYVFAVRMACFIEVEKKLGIKLPIILDSPSGKEIDDENIQKMMNILNRDFSNNQIIVASIFEYDLNNLNKIIIRNRLIETEQN